MSDITYELAKYLDDANFGTLGTDIFVAQIPDGVNGVYVSPTGGNSNSYIPMNDVVLDIYAKDTSASDCITLLNNIKNYIHRMHNTVTANSYIYSILVLGDVENVERDLEYAKVYKITVLVKSRDTSLIS